MKKTLDKSRVCADQDCGKIKEGEDTFDTLTKKTINDIDVFADQLDKITREYAKKKIETPAASAAAVAGLEVGPHWPPPPRAAGRAGLPRAPCVRLGHPGQLAAALKRRPAGHPARNEPFGGARARFGLLLHTVNPSCSGPSSPRL